VLPFEEAVFTEPSHKRSAPHHQGHALVPGFAFLPKLQAKEFSEEPFGLFPHGFVLMDGKAYAVPADKPFSPQETQEKGQLLCQQVRGADGGSVGMKGLIQRGQLNRGTCVLVQNPNNPVPRL
jgi:hypothetical protein